MSEAIVQQILAEGEDSVDSVVLDDATLIQVIAVSAEDPDEAPEIYAELLDSKAEFARQLSDRALAFADCYLWND
jgi:capsule polysaccharide export protein KpsE/RkpR